MSRYKILCLECDKQQELTGEETPRFCPLCGSANIKEITTMKQMKRVVAERNFERLNQLKETLISLGNLYDTALNEYDCLISQLRLYRRQKVITSEELQPFIDARKEMQWKK